MQETFEVAGISCDHCKATIEKALQPLKGVERADVDVSRRSVTVSWDAGAIERTRLVAAMEEAGYAVAPSAG